MIDAVHIHVAVPKRRSFTGKNNYGRHTKRAVEMGFLAGACVKRRIKRQQDNKKMID